ncbi:LysR family transcriptional regulator [Leifsonia kafniensis]|uniref:LysR family transcriptional regulator n=2 Tax=Leifsonia kafniensis TaxID=475957 RepID=A0ABP7KLM9_9MICO
MRQVHVTVRQLEVFIVMARELHFAHAAKALHLSQPTVSAEIRKLEEALGVELFERSTRTTLLSAAGAALLADAAHIHAQLVTFEETARLYSRISDRTVTVVASPSVVDRLLPAVISKAEKILPDLVIDEIAADTGTVTSVLFELDADIGLGRFLEPLPGFQVETLAEEEVFAVLSRGNPHAADPTVNLSALAGLPLLLWPRERSPRYYDAILALCHDRGLTPTVLEAPARIVGSRSYLIGENRAFTLIPGSARAHLSDDLRAVPLSAPALLPIEMLFRPNDPRPFVGELIDVIRARAARLLAHPGVAG